MMTERRGRPQGSTGRAPVLTTGQIQAVLRVARNRRRLAGRSVAALALSLGLGLRAKELAALRWSDIYEVDGSLRQVLHLKAAYTKGSKTRDVFLSSPKLRRILDVYGAGSPQPLVEAPLFTSQKGGPLTPASMARFIKVIYCDAGLPRATSHTGRRTLITRLAERGVDLKSIAAIAGHASIRTTAIYVESNPARLSRILQEAL